MNEEFLRQLIAELVSSQGHALRVLASAAADTSGDREKFSEAVQYHSARLQHAEPHPISQDWIDSVLLDLRGGG
jgi:hypothetical protein